MIAAIWIGAAAAGGCGKPVLRLADASLGDYYSPEEFKHLSREQRDEYCNELALQDSTYQDDAREARDALAALAGQRDPLAREADSLTARADSLDALLAAAGTAPAAANRAAGGGGADVHVVRTGESLWRISGSAGVYGSGRMWRKLYEANRDRIRNPDLVYPGQELRIPR